MRGKGSKNTKQEDLGVNIDKEERERRNEEGIEV